jgi:hypothetical protein
MSIARWRASKHSVLTTEDGVFRGIRAEELSWRQSTLQAVEMRVQLWSVNQRATEAGRISIAKIRYQGTSGDNTANEESLWRTITT